MAGFEAEYRAVEREEAPPATSFAELVAASNPTEWE